MRFFSSLWGVSAIAGFSLVESKKLTINPMKHSVTPVIRSDFDRVISNARDRQVAVVYFYKPDDEDSEKYFESFNLVALELRGMFKFAGVNCEDQAKLCKDESVDSNSSFPVVKLYPMRPLLVEDLPRTMYDKFNDEKSGLKKVLYKLLSSEYVEKLTAETLPGFLAKEDHLPRVLWLSSKKAVPPEFKSLSTQFNKDMHFAFLASPSEDVLKQFKIKSDSNLPKIILLQSGVKKHLVYDGELNFTDLHDWVNLRRETFAKGGGFDHTMNQSESSGGSGLKVPPKPWLTEDIPEMFSKSHKDVCFKFDEGLCVIYLTNGPISESEVAMLTGVKSKHANESIKFRFSWMNMAIEQNFKALFEPAEDAMPNVVVFNPHKRPRFAGPLDGTPATASGISNLIEKIVAGEGRYKMVPNKELPAFAERPKESAKDEL